uniref:Antigenic protein, putative n=1 Tax=Toxoplasma gondii (strain ATCC 50861 / VEG) TaxID=432359 RepID=A0A0F7V1Q9_TOXGV|nr:TPA: antigenic protein, putative [Toxoplasma gondii VEG]
MVNCTAIFSTMGIPGVLLVSLSLLAVSFPVCSGQENAYTFVNSKASSTFGPEFDALRAIQAGAGYWSSSGHHSGDEAVTWTGFFESPAYLKGLRVRWAYSPEELWRTNANQQFIAARSKPPKCLTLQDGNTAAGVGDIAKSFNAAATCSSVADSKHMPMNAVDGDPTTYWASEAFGDANPHPVDFSVNLGKPARVSGVRIDWEYPAQAYRIDGSLDGTAFSELASNMANPSNSTLEVFAGSEAQFLRIALLQPHSKNGKVGDKYFYGIRDVEVLANRLQTVVGDCREAANSNDARDKYFVESTSTFDPAFADKISSIDDDVLDRTEALDKKTNELRNVLPHAKACLSEKQEYEGRIVKSAAESASIVGQHDQFTEMQTSNQPIHMELSPEPLVLRSADHLQAIKDATELIGNCLQDLYSGSTDLTALLMSQSSLSTELGRMTPAAGVGLAGKNTSYFDMDLSDIAAVVCSTNAMEGEDVLPHVDIPCDATAEEHEAFRGIINTNVVVECPPGCEEHSTLPVYGSGGVYSDSSSVCRAAIHAGVIKSGGVVNISLESPRESYEGSTRNGIKSAALNTPNNVELVDLVMGEALRGELPSRSRGVAFRSIRVGPVAKDCPIEEFAAPASSFLELTSSSNLESTAEASETPNEKQENVMLDPSVALVIRQMLQQMDAIHGVDPATVFAAQSQAAEAVREIKKYLKSAEVLQRKQAARTEELYLAGEDLMTKILAEAGRYFNGLEELYVELERAEEQRLEEAGFSSFELNYETMPFSQTFAVYDTLRVKNGPSSWGYSEDTVAGHRNMIVQTSAIIGSHDGDGTFAMLKGHRFFDFIAQADLYAVGSGSIGVSFRMRDPNNMFLFEANRERGYKRLIRIDSGDAVIIAQRDDGGYEGGTCVLDERFLSGSIGLYSSGMDGGVFFDNVRIKAKTCSHISREAPPLPPRCARFIEMYLERPEALYEVPVLDGGDTKPLWQYKARHYKCHMYLVYSVKPMPSHIRINLSRTENGVKKTLASKAITPHTGQWNRVELQFHGPDVVVLLSAGNGHQEALKAKLPDEGDHGQVGLLSAHCDHHAFDRLSLSPPETIEEATNVAESRNKKSW